MCVLIVTHSKSLFLSLQIVKYRKGTLTNGALDVLGGLRSVTRKPCNFERSTSSTGCFGYVAFHGQRAVMVCGIATSARFRQRRSWAPV